MSRFHTAALWTHRRKAFKVNGSHTLHTDTSTPSGSRERQGEKQEREPQGGPVGRLEAQEVANRSVWPGGGAGGVV